MWSSIQVLPNQISKKFFYTLEDIDLRESHAQLHKKPIETLGADSIRRLEISICCRPGNPVFCTVFVCRNEKYIY